MTYDDWKTTDPSDAETCQSGHFHCDGNHEDDEPASPPESPDGSRGTR